MTSENHPVEFPPFLFSYLNPDHELAAAAALGEMAPGISLSLSHQVATEWREYERTASAVMDAYIAPSVSRYMADLSTRLGDQGMSAPLLVMQSNGGVISAQSASERPLQTLLSGPVGGAAGGVALSEVLDRANLICIDLGGTSFDVSLITDGQADSSPSALLEGLPMLMPVVDIHTIGAGGGSLAYLQAGGLRVGPESAGAHPGPACYGRGGTQPTVTDANLALGRIDPGYFLGGNLTLDTRAADVALENLGHELGLNHSRMALGIIEVLNAKMSQAIRTLTVERGIEPRQFSLVAFGGAGPMHAVALAQELGIDEVVVPPDPGGFSAWGMLQSAVRQDFSEAFFRDFANLDTTDLEDWFARLGEQAFSSLLGEGVPHDRISLIHRLDIRYQGQEHTLTVTLPNGLSPSMTVGWWLSVGVLKIPIVRGTATPIQRRHWRPSTFGSPPWAIWGVRFCKLTIGPMNHRMCRPRPRLSCSPPAPIPPPDSIGTRWPRGASSMAPPLSKRQRPLP